MQTVTIRIQQTRIGFVFLCYAVAVFIFYTIGDTVIIGIDIQLIRTRSLFNTVQNAIAIGVELLLYDG